MCVSKHDVNPNESDGEPHTNVPSDVLQVEDPETVPIGRTTYIYIYICIDLDIHVEQRGTRSRSYFQISQHWCYRPT